MNASVNLKTLFDADALFRQGECPWTFFAYPTSVAEPTGLPPDRDAQLLLAELQSRGIEVAIWRSDITENTTYFACRYIDRNLVEQVVADLEARGILPHDFLFARSEALFANRMAGN